MNRTTFLNKLLSTTLVSKIPLEVTKEFRKIYLMQCFVAGFRHYDGMYLVDSMKEGDLLELKREPKNEFDFYAIALYFRENKIGFIPKEVNLMLSSLLDSEALSLFAVISHLEKSAKPWENVSVSIYFLQQVNHSLPAHANYLTRIETPHYRTLKHKVEQIGLGIEALFQTKNRVIDLDKIPRNEYEFIDELNFHFKKLTNGKFANGNYLLVDNDTIFSFIENIKDNIKEIKDEFNNSYLEIEFNLS
jgi:hypothetical protein